MLRTEYAIRTIKDAYEVLGREEDLSPNNPAINHALSRLVDAASREYTQAEEQYILLDPTIRKMRAAAMPNLARAESEMERFWAEKFCEKQVITQSDLEEFWYWNNYTGLVGGEIKHFPEELYAPNESICFVGSGPLPLTAIVLNQQTGRRVTCVDIDPIACEISSELIRKAGYATSIDVVCANGADYNFSKHPSILIASLVPNKTDVMTRIRESGVTPCIGLRSAEGLHTLLYEPVDESDDEFGHCTLAAKTSHDPKIINTTVFYHGQLGNDFERNKTIKGKTRPKWGWRNTTIPILTPEPVRG